MATLPQATRYVVIDGGNQKQMRDYIGQPNDPPATVTRDEQQVQGQAATIELLAEIDALPSETPGPSTRPVTASLPLEADGCP